MKLILLKFLKKKSEISNRIRNLNIAKVICDMLENTQNDTKQLKFLRNGEQFSMTLLLIDEQIGITGTYSP